ncbi:MAG: hypothetical protein A3F69_06730 [Acidobacteria bacterium RIFCSPLOWO2_12_FULL_66_10]|nr:MAG: hypothetical protein A3F69_06730 [Acidobacteria bacterium RIFCSPLOWO2_12_FULL_66_10]
MLIESGVDWAHDQQYPLSGLKGNLIAVPTIGISVGISSIAEFQIDGGFYNRLNVTARHPAPLSSLLTTSESTTHDVSDTVIATKIRVLSETAGRPAMGLRFATKLPNASNESGLGLDTIDVFASLLGAKTIQSIRVVSNVGVGILADPISGNRQNDVLTYGLSFARAMTERAEIVGELNGRKSTRGGDAFPGTESRGILKLGGRFTHGPVRFDTGLFFGLAAVDPAIGFTAGFTYVFDAFTIP